ncbi:Type 1 glutamine amidotransferase-like domain-containing protein [Myroides pelagicus]|uniref:Type 1 glutamine amidotransferase-like domain-containing protein n=1 Tax=Myroides pelagicus TaxID=270914 RepID=UPI002DB77F64|nr:Type 1 glutamine amidotransferase-like domain-containing protein [Myroides pelagicus]MEC4114824.1 Type 1 glutamine amidotransferase-like domain-containing protein [Myroides pelagicus]
MKRMFLAASFSDVMSLFIEFVGEQVKGKSVTFIPTASIIEQYTGHVSNDQLAFEALGIKVDVLELTNATLEEILEKLTSNDYIFVSGGNTFFLLQELKRSGADQIIIDQVAQGKVYIGTSAGSMVMSPDIKYIEAMDERAKAPLLEGTTALGLIDKYPIAHFKNAPFAEVVDQIIEDFMDQLPLVPLSNHQVLLIRGEQIDIKQI